MALDQLRQLNAAQQNVDSLEEAVTEAIEINILFRQIHAHLLRAVDSTPTLDDDEHAPDRHFQSEHIEKLRNQRRWFTDILLPPEQAPVTGCTNQHQAMMELHYIQKRVDAHKIELETEYNRLRVRMHAAWRQQGEKQLTQESDSARRARMAEINEPQSAIENVDGLSGLILNIVVESEREALAKWLDERAQLLETKQKLEDDLQRLDDLASGDASGGGMQQGTTTVSIVDDAMMKQRYAQLRSERARYEALVDSVRRILLLPAVAPSVTC